MKARIFPAILLIAGVVLMVIGCNKELPMSFTLYVWGVPIAAVGLFRMIFIQKVKGCFHFATTVSSLAVSAAAGGAVAFALASVAPFCLDGPSIRDPFCEAAFVICYGLFFLLLGLYVFFRCRRWSALGFWMDVVRGGIFCPAMAWVALWIGEWIKDMMERGLK